MCGRFTLATPLDEVARLFGAELDPTEGFPARYNIAPTEPIPVVRHRPDGRREVRLLRWGLLPSWVSDPDDFPTLLNARAESLERKPAFQDALRERRCVMPADGFYEWREENGRQPYYVRSRQRAPFAFAGLWERWLGPDGRPVESCTIITTEANDLLRPLHDRMPAILSPEARERWLDAALPPDAVRTCLRPADAGELEVFAVSRRVNRVEEDDPGLIEPQEGDAGGRDEPPSDGPDPERPGGAQLELL